MRRVNFWIMMMAMALYASGCAMHNVAGADQAPAAAATDTSSAATGTDTSGSGSGTADQSGNAIPTPPPAKMVAGFDDIPVPADLKRDDKLSFVYEAPSVTMGVITYSGYDKGASVARFFRTEMPNYGWQFLNAFSEGNAYMVAFLKANRSCIINIEEGTLSTKVTIKVGPTGAGASAGASAGTGGNASPPLHYEVGH